MSLHALHRLTGAQFIRLKPNLCPYCERFKPHKEWCGICEAKDKLVCDPHTDVGRCADFSRAEKPWLDEVTIADWTQMGRETRKR